MVPYGGYASSSFYRSEGGKRSGFENEFVWCFTGVKEVKEDHHEPKKGQKTYFLTQLSFSNSTNYLISTTALFLDFPDWYSTK